MSSEEVSLNGYNPEKTRHASLPLNYTQGTDFEYIYIFMSRTHFY